MNLVCPRCGTRAEDHRYCANCGLSLHDRPQLPTREDWERQVLAAAQEFAAEPPARRRSRWKVLAVVLAVAAVVGGAVTAVVLLVDASDDDSSTNLPTASQTPATPGRGPSADDRPTRAGDLDACAERWNSDRRILRSGYARGAETAFVRLDSRKRCVIALPPAAARRPGFATFVQVEGRFWGSYTNNPPKGRGRAATRRALAKARAFERRAAEKPNARVRGDGTITIASGK